MTCDEKKLQELKKKIEKTRNKLNLLVQDGNFMNKETMKLSQQLDRLIIEYINNNKEESNDD
ncbi:aspartyl-phosphate phosphatase Spo0E family protein [Alkaliphilus peptidifermentans]|uniref:Spo0E like sporulation regulatory protein n=1 Tax=Alkaliphilus peptidifermentans DSM 18978 TaxID=1120976 RepID=A0A1G5FIN6_9FIRM|nr:aspartyl-phosphate phosphatase Spo0E family protein [Alkaliphilus peptidifermentans]SCY39106.1 Spo0E like sporulation regulatory protein [Alkaliphilus peptidifermentans DSM 18978]